MGQSVIEGQLSILQLRSAFTALKMRPMGIALGFFSRRATTEPVIRPGAREGSINDYHEKEVLSDIVRFGRELTPLAPHCQNP
jgi:hypothetical protein